VNPLFEIFENGVGVGNLNAEGARYTVIIDDEVDPEVFVAVIFTVHEVAYVNPENTAVFVGGPVYTTGVVVLVPVSVYV